MLSSLALNAKPIVVDGVTLTPRTTKRNLFVILVAGLAGFSFGYANNSIAGSFAQPTFLSYFLNDARANDYIGGMLGGFLGGGFVGAVIQAPISNKYGRRICTAFGAVLGVIAAAIMAGSVNVGMFIAGRVISGVGAGICITNPPVYMSEISPPHTRGMLTGSHAITIVFAYITSSVLALGFSYVEAPYQWRLQFIVLTVVCLALLVSIYFIPESPRWLAEQDRFDEALRVLEDLHRSEHDPDALLARAEMRQIRAQIESEKSLPTSYAFIIRNPSTRKRAICASLVWIMGQSTGILVIANLTPTLFGKLGYGLTLQLGLSIVWVTTALIGCFVNNYLMDIIGRVKLLVAGGYLCSITMIIEAVLQKYYLASDNQTGVRAAVAMYFLFIIFYGCTIDCAAYPYVAEIWPTHLRSKGSSFGLGAFFLTAIAYNSPASLAFATIGWKYYLVMVSVCVTSATIMIFVCPETKGLTLEEIGAKFGDEVVVHLDGHAEKSDRASSTGVEVGKSDAQRVENLAV